MGSIKKRKQGRNKVYNPRDGLCAFGEVFLPSYMCVTGNVFNRGKTFRHFIERLNQTNYIIHNFLRHYVLYIMSI